MFLPQYKTTKKRQISKEVKILDKYLDLNLNSNKTYNVKNLKDNTIYVKGAWDQLPVLYLLIFSKGYSEKDDLWESVSTLLYFWKIMSIFYWEYLEKSIETFLRLNLWPFLPNFLLYPLHNIVSHFICSVICYITYIEKC